MKQNILKINYKTTSSNLFNSYLPFLLKNKILLIPFLMKFSKIHFYIKNSFFHYLTVKGFILKKTFKTNHINRTIWIRTHIVGVLFFYNFSLFSYDSYINL